MNVPEYFFIAQDIFQGIIEVGRILGPGGRRSASAGIGLTTCKLTISFIGEIRTEVQPVGQTFGNFNFCIKAGKGPYSSFLINNGEVIFLG